MPKDNIVMSCAKSGGGGGGMDVTQRISFPTRMSFMSKNRTYTITKKIKVNSQMKKTGKLAVFSD